MRSDVDGPAELVDGVVEDGVALMALCFESEAGSVTGREGSAGERRGNEEVSETEEGKRDDREWKEDERADSHGDRI